MLLRDEDDAQARGAQAHGHGLAVDQQHTPQRRPRSFSCSKEITELKKYSTSSRPVFLLVSPGGACRRPVARVPADALYAPLTPPSVSRRCAGEQLEVIEGINAPALSKAVDAHIPEGLLDVGGDDETGAGDDDADE